MKPIRVKPGTLQKLKELRAYPEEPINDVITRLLDMYDCTTFKKLLLNKAGFQKVGEKE